MDEEDLPDPPEAPEEGDDPVCGGGEVRRDKDPKEKGARGSPGARPEDEDMGAGVPEHPRCDLILGMFGSSENPWEHVRLLARLARIVHTEASRRNLRMAVDGQDLYRKLLEEDRSHE